MSNEKPSTLARRLSREINGEQEIILTNVEKSEEWYKATGNPLHALHALYSIMVPRVPNGTGTIDDETASISPRPGLPEIEANSPGGYAEPTLMLELPAWLAEYLWGFVRSVHNLSEGRAFDEQAPGIPANLTAERHRQHVTAQMGEARRIPQAKVEEILWALGVPRKQGANIFRSYARDVAAELRDDFERAEARQAAVPLSEMPADTLARTAVREWRAASPPAGNGDDAAKKEEGRQRRRARSRTKQADDGAERRISVRDREPGRE